MGLSLVDFLEQSYKQKKLKNNQYSIRSFARDLDVSSGRLVNILKRKSIPGPKIINRFFEKLSVPEAEQLQILQSLEQERFLKRGLGFEKELNESELEQLGNWKSWALYTLIQRGDFDGTEKWIEQHSGFNTDEVRSLLQGLLQIGLIERQGDLLLRQKIQNVTTTRDIPSKTIRELHRQFLRQASESLEKHSVNERDITGITMCINREKLPEAKQLISQFRAQLNKLLEDGECREVYHLGIQLFPVIPEVQSEK
jgi:uncharacterized protein (TIGR02147 family)